VRQLLLVAGATAALLLGACTADDTPGMRPGSGAVTTTDASGNPTTVTPAETSPSEPSDVTAEPFEPQTITVAMSGDVLLHEGLWASAEADAARTGRGDMDFRPMLADMRPVISGADFAVCHMETPVAPKGGPYEGYPLFAAPPQVVGALKWEGYDACTTASNHSVDQGFEGLARTLDAFDEVGILHDGTARRAKEMRTPLLVEVNGVKIALISATYGTNGIPLPADQPWSVQQMRPDEIIAKAQRARAAGAQLVLVAMHWGSEYQHEPNGDQLAVADALTRSPAVDFVYGHHAHVVQPYDRVNGKWVVYGLGNMVAQQSTSVEGVYDGNTARVTFVSTPRGRFKVQRLEYIPTMVTRYDGSAPMRWLNVQRSLADPRYAGLRDELRATFQRVREAVNLHGAFKRGVITGR
jgi:poly-gamma-glutamate capsule biosynthesis protein CapA/YwtB (metallophosphatase superfamily)